ncbi:hypothetical protein IKF84_01975 [Candidatus Saccharibacteria bacterium]|nr:hypothetical protein [Candidatus Saccharibacteria bacterium]
MIRIFTGDDRVRAGQEIKKLLGESYEVIDCADLTIKDLTPIFKGATLFDSHRKILLRDFTTNSSIFPELPKFLDTKHDVILLETKLDKRTATYKEIKDKIEIKEFKLPQRVDFREVYNIFNVAKKDGKKAVEMLKKIESDEDPIRFTGLLVSQALKDYQKNQGTKEKQVLGDLSKLDIRLKSTKIAPWLLVESFLLKLS